MQFNFSKLRLFDKMGHPVPLSFIGVMKITFTDDFGKRTSFLAETDSSLNITNTIKIEHSGRFTEEMFDNDNIAGVIDADSSVYDAEFTVSRSKINSAGDTVYYSIDDIDIASVKTAADSMNISLEYPGVLFNANILFNEVSTELVETQNVFIGIQDSSALVSLADYFSNDNDFISRYRLFFFIDNRTDKEFRLFTVQDDEVVWSDRYIMDLRSSGRVDIGFCSEQEGFFEDEMYVCFVDTHIKESDDDLGKVYPIGKISLNAESVGEDERYRTLFTNFGIPDPKTYSGIFRNTDLAEEKTDNILLNENSKRMFLSYTDIFPYAGTYKALINAVNILGYDDIFFKEWYKKIGTDTPEKDYITYDISYHADLNANTINNVPIEERIQLRKLNWLSMVYHINEEISGAAVDEYGFPQTENINTYNNSEILVKLMSLKNWLEKYVIGLNCRIIDVGGEGIIFERYLLNTYGTVQQQLPYDAVKNIYAYTGTELAGYDNAVLTLESKQRSSVEQNPTAQISFEIGDDSSSLMIDNLKYMRFIDFCNGYFDSNNVYHTGIPADSSVTEDTILAGGTFQFAEPFDRYSVKAYNIADKFSFDTEGIGDVEGSNLRIENDSIYINPYQKYRKDSSVSDMALFKDLPIIQVERGTIHAKDKIRDKSVIYKIYPNSDNDSSMNYILENVRTFERDSVQDRVTLIPGRWEDETRKSVTLTVSATPETAVIKLNGEIRDIITVAAGASVNIEITADGYESYADSVTVNVDTVLYIDLKKIQYTFTINTSPSNAVVTMNGEVTKELTVDPNTEINYTVSAEGFQTVTGTHIVTKNETIEVNLAVLCTVTIQTNPANAIVMIDGIQRNSITVVQGTLIHYTVSADGYETATATLIVVDSGVTYVELLKYCTLTITSAPENAKIEINGEERNTITVTEGTTINYKVSADGYITDSGQHTVEKDDTLHIVLSIQEIWCVLTIRAIPEEAEIKINGQEAYIARVLEGTEISYEVSLDGYYTVSKKYVVTKDEVITITLEKIEYYTLTLESTPENAKKTINGIEQNQITVESGTTISYTVSLFGYETVTELHTVTKNETITVNLVERTDAFIYETTSANQSVKIVNKQSEIHSIEFENGTYEKKDPQLTGAYEHVFAAPGSHKVFIKFAEDQNNIHDGYALFENCTNLISVPSTAFWINGAAVHWYRFEDTFKGCTNLESIPENLFYGCDNTNFTSVFENCSKITTIPASLFVNNNATTDSSIRFSYAFAGCSNLQTVPAGLFKNIANAVYFNHIFYNCKKILSLPNELFSGDSSAYTFEYAFAGCTSLKTVPGDIFNGCSNTVNFNHVFFGCSSLEEVPEHLFKNCTHATDFTSAFQNCTKLSNISSTAFVGCSSVETFYSAFHNCTNLTALSETLFTDTVSVNNFSYAFAYCEKLNSIPETLFAACADVTTFNHAFAGCESLDSIPELLFSTNVNVTDFGYVFADCISLNEIPTELFSTNVNATNFANAFEETAITNIPATLFSKNVNASSFADTFRSCNNLTNIPALLFSENINAKNFSSVFANCEKISQIPEQLFANNTAATDFYYAFYDCSINSIPEQLFANNVNVTNFSRCFQDCTLITEIPENLFANNVNATDFSYCFSNTDITEIPAQLFVNNVNAKNFSKCFERCTLVTEIPENLFANNVNATNFSSCFSNTAITEIPAQLFANNVNATDFSYCFALCHNLTEIPATLLSTNIQVRNANGMFQYCENIIAIPVNLFKNNTKVQNINNIFSNCSNITEIPEDFLSGLTLLNDISNAFYRTNITEIPATLLDSCESIKNFSYAFAFTPIVSVPQGLLKSSDDYRTGYTGSNFVGMFYDCSLLTTIPSDLFANVEIYDISNCFYNCISLTSACPIDKDNTPIYNRMSPGKKGYAVISEASRYKNCFYNCMQMSDYDSIPASWKGTGNISLSKPTVSKNTAKIRKKIFKNNDIKTGNIIIYPFNSDASILVSRTNAICSDSSFNSDGAEHFISTDYTYGFRYSTSNSLNIPMFSILGYTAEDIPIFKNLSEMTIEILEGRLLFNDSTNSRNVYVNFTHEPSTGRQTINVESVYEYNDIYPVKYLTGNDTYDTALYDSSAYAYFTERYESADSSCIVYNLLHGIDVNSAGSYHVAVTGYDEHNNMYTVPARGTSDIFTPDVSLTIYSNDNSDSSADASVLSDGYSEYCIYPETVMVKNLTVSRDDIYKTDTSTEIQYNSYSYALSVPDSSDYLHLMNIADEFEAAGITKKVSCFPSFSTDVMNSYSVALNRTHTKYINKFMDWNSGDEITAICQELQRDASTGKYDVDTFLETVSGHPEITNFDVNVIFYNKLGGYPELQTYGWMIGCAGLPEKYFTDAAQYKSADEFRLYLPDKSTTSFVWAETVSAARQDICVHISENALNSLPDTYDKEYCSGIIGDTVEYMLKAAEQVADDSVWKTILKNLYSSVSTTPQEFDNATYRYNGYSIETDGSTYNPYNILRYKYSKANEREALEILRKNMLSLGNTSEFLNEVKLFLSNDHNDASISALTFMDTYMEMFYTDDSLLEIAAGAAVLLSKNAEWGTDVSQKLVPYYKYIYDMFFKEGSLMYSAVSIINDGIPSGEEGSRIMVENSNRTLVIETGARETLQNSLNDIINKYIKANPEYKTLIRQTIYRDFYIQMVYTIYKYIFLLYFSYIISRGDLLQYPVYAATDHPAIIGNTQEIIDAALTDETIDGVSVPDASNGVMAEFILARLGSDDAQKSVFYVPMYYNSDVEVYTPVEFDGDSSYGQQAQYRTASKEYDIDWDPDTMQFVVNWKEDASLGMNSYELNTHPYGNILVCIPQYQENMAELFIATGKALYEYNRRCEYLGNATIDRYIRNEMLTDDKWLTIAKNDSSYYAVISETGDYVKTGDNPLDGLSVGGSMLPIVPDIYQYLNNPEYSIYVQPIWKSAVQIGILNEFTENNTISTDVPLDDPNERYIYVEYLENSFSCRFNIGEIVRLTFYRTAPDNSQVFESACSYRVVGYDSTGEILVLKGYINESQFAEVYNPVYALLQNTALDPSVNEQIEAARVNQTINIINVPYDNEYGTGEYEMRIARLNPDNLQELYYTPVYYDTSAGEYRQMETSEMTVSGFQIYISYAHHTFVDYVMRPAGISSDNSNNISIAVQKNHRSGHCLQFIDDTFIMDIKDFDKTDAYRYWDTGITVDDNRLPSVCSQPIYEHTDIPVTVTKGQNIAIKSFIKNTDDAGQTEYKRYWKIYRSDSLSDSPEYKFTSFNETLYLTCADYGYYDIECFIYDKYGNTSQKYFKNAVIVR